MTEPLIYGHATFDDHEVRAMSDIPRTAAGRALLAREAYNSRSFALITGEAIRAIEDEAREQALAEVEAAIGGLRCELTGYLNCNGEGPHLFKSDDLLAALAVLRKPVQPKGQEMNDHDEWKIDEALSNPMPDPDLATPLTAEEARRLRRVATAALNTWVGRNWPSMADMRRDGIGAGLVERSGRPDQAIRRFLDTFQPEFVADLLDRVAAALATREPDPAGLRVAAFENPKYVAFTVRASEMMLRRLDHGRAKFGVDWDEEPYSDEDNLGRLRRAVDHLEAAHRSSPDPEEWQKRAADVANQAFMFADPARLSKDESHA